MGRSGARPRRTKPPAWTPDLAYIVGLIATDGNLSSDGRHIDITSKDIEILKHARSILGLTCKIGTKISGFTGGRIPHIQFGDVILYRWLKTIGFTTRKSLTLGAIKIPHKYFNHFLRGLYDGDGSFYSYWDPRWKSSFMFYLTFISGSKSHITWLSRKIKKLYNVSGKIGVSTRSFYLRFAKRTTQKLISTMYPRDDVPHIIRKYQKIKLALAKDAQHNQYADVEKLENSLP